MPNLPRIRRTRSGSGAVPAGALAERRPLELAGPGLSWVHLDSPDADTAHALAKRFGWHELDVEWAGEPGWFFRLSKLVLPLVRHPSVPRSYFLDEHPVSEDDLHRYVLKPLFSFAGKGLVLDLDKEALAAIPEAERASFVLQEKVHYADVVKTPDGSLVRCEVRLMFLWLDRPVHVLVLPRFSRGRLMGCAFNTAEPWTGHGVAFWPRD